MQSAVLNSVVLLVSLESIVSWSRHVSGLLSGHGLVDHGEVGQGVIGAIFLDGSRDGEVGGDVFREALHLGHVLRRARTDFCHIYPSNDKSLI